MDRSECELAAASNAAMRNPGAAAEYLGAGKRAIQDTARDERAVEAGRVARTYRQPAGINQEVK